MKSGRYRSTGRKMKNFQKTGLEYRIRIGLILCKIKGIYNGWFEIDNSKRIIDNIVNDLTNNFEKKFSQEDSVIIFKLSSSCEVLRYGYAKNEESDFLIIT